MLSDVASWKRLKKLGAQEWIRDKMAKGQIRQIGFSYHGNSDMFCQIIDANDWDFCMIQYNYMDEHSQAGKRAKNHCPQNIDIPNQLKTVQKEMEGAVYKIARSIVKTFTRF